MFRNSGGSSYFWSFSTWANDSMLVLQEVWCQSIYLYIIYNYIINLFSCCSSLSWFEPHFKAIGCGWQAGVNGDRNQHQSTIPALAAYEYAVLPGGARNHSVTLCQECHKWWICQQDWPSKSFNNVYSSTSVIKAVFKVVQIHRQTETGCCSSKPAWFEGVAPFSAPYFRIYAAWRPCTRRFCKTLTTSVRTQ